MKKPSKQRTRTRISIQRPQGTLSIDTEKTHGIYYPVADTTGRGKQPDVPQKPDDEIELEYPSVSKKKWKKQRHSLRHRDACLALCDFPNAVAGAGTAATLLLLILLCQAAHLLVDTLPIMPVIYLDAAARAVSPVLHPLLWALQGPDRWEGFDWTLHRPWIVQATLALGESKPSSQLSDYIGGTFRDSSWKKRKFCFPFLDSAVVMMPGLPSAVSNQLTALSPLALPIVFESGRRNDGRPVLELTEGHLESYDKHQLEQLSELERDCYQEIISFLSWFRKQRHIDRWKNDIDLFRPVVQHGRFQQLVSDTRTDLLCAALSFFKQYLHFASAKQEWITGDEANEILLRYWRLVMPESVPTAGKAPDGCSVTAYHVPADFYRFLIEWYLPTYRSQILQGRSGTAETMGLLYNINSDTCHFIAPRSAFLTAYRQWLEEHDAVTFSTAKKGDEATVQRELLDAGVPLKHERNNLGTWRYAFYGKDTASPKASPIPCLALPILQLPEEVQTVFGELFGSAVPELTLPSRSETLPN